MRRRWMSAAREAVIVEGEVSEEVFTFSGLVSRATWIAASRPAALARPLLGLRPAR